MMRAAGLWEATPTPYVAPPPTMAPAPTPAPVPTPPPDLEQRVAGCFEPNATAHQVESALETCPALKELGPRAIIAEGNERVLLLDVGRGCEAYIESFVVWGEGEAWRVQSLEPLLPHAYDPGTSIVSLSPYPPPNGTLVRGPSARAVSDGGPTRLGLIIGQAGCGSGPFGGYVLLSLVEQQWILSWDGVQAFQGLIGQTAIEYSGVGLDAIVVNGTSYTRRDEKTGILAEHKLAPIRSIDQTWVRQGDAYILTKEVVAPSPSNTMLEFLYRLALGDEAGASELATEPSLLTTAREAGLVRDPNEIEWLLNCTGGWRAEGPVVLGPCVLHKPDGTGVTIEFVQNTDNWLISAIEPCTYWYDERGVQHCG